MKLETEPYLDQAARWPSSGRHILAQFDDEFVVVYQAYRPSIGHFAAEHGYFGGDFKLTRMSWIKPNFLWMMYRCGWAEKEGQEVVLAVRILRSAFDTILTQAVHSTFQPTLYADHDGWKKAVATSDVRLQFDPDHHPSGAPVERRAIQLGLRGDVLARYAREWIVGIEDISDFVRDQHEHVIAKNLGELVTPRENVYPVEDVAVRERLGVD
jgi:hypothetical protein